MILEIPSEEYSFSDLLEQSSAFLDKHGVTITPHLFFMLRDLFMNAAYASRRESAKCTVSVCLEPLIGKAILVTAVNNRNGDMFVKVCPNTD